MIELMLCETEDESILCVFVSVADCLVRQKGIRDGQEVPPCLLRSVLGKDFAADHLPSGQDGLQIERAAIKLDNHGSYIFL